MAGEEAWAGWGPVVPLLGSRAHYDEYPIVAMQPPISMREAVLQRNMQARRIRSEGPPGADGIRVRKVASECGEIEWLLRNCAASGRDETGALPECYWAGSKEASVACWRVPVPRGPHAHRRRAGAGSPARSARRCKTCDFQAAIDLCASPVRFRSGRPPPLLPPPARGGAAHFAPPSAAGASLTAGGGAGGATRARRDGRCRTGPCPCARSGRG
jgi:hypothetical protein